MIKCKTCGHEQGDHWTSLNRGSYCNGTIGSETMSNGDCDCKQFIPKVLCDKCGHTYILCDCKENKPSGCGNPFRYKGKRYWCNNIKLCPSCSPNYNLQMKENRLSSCVSQDATEDKEPDDKRSSTLNGMANSFDSGSPFILSEKVDFIELTPVYFEEDVKEFIQRRNTLDWNLRHGFISDIEHFELKNKLAGGLK